VSTKRPASQAGDIYSTITKREQPGFQDADCEMWMLGQAGSNSQTSRAAANNEKIEWFLGEGLARQLMKIHAPVWEPGLDSRIEKSIRYDAGKLKTQQFINQDHVTVTSKCQPNARRSKSPNLT
jgi:hypothetical protein